MGRLIVLGIIAVMLWYIVRPWLARPPAMGLDDARKLLGVSANADAETIRAAHRRIIARVHPDAGGTEELARRTNLARDLLLKAVTGDSQPRS